MKKKKPLTERECALYRAGLSCSIGCDVLDGKIEVPNGHSAMEYAIYNLIHAVSDLAKAMGENNEKEKG